MAIHIIKTGLQLSVQDMGRLGSRRFGVPIGGSMDMQAAQIANILCGNELNAAVLEVVLHGAKLCADATHLISFTGSGARVFINEEEVALYRPIKVAPGTIIDFKYHSEGCRMYMAIAGGFETPMIMGSRSFSSVLDMQPLEIGSKLHTSHISALAQKLMNHSNGVASWGSKYSSDKSAIRFIAGPEWEMLNDGSKELWVENKFEVKVRSNRMGYRLKGPALETIEPVQMISTAVMPGTVQLTPEGDPLLLMADAQTTGGYPRIAQVIEADLSKCAQKRPGDIIQFEKVTLEIALQEFETMKRFISDLQKSVRINFS